MNSQRPRTLALTPTEFLRRFLQQVLPTGFMKVRYFGFLSPSCAMSIEEVKGRIELAQGFAVSAPRAMPAAAEPERPHGMFCPHCGGKLRWCSVVLPRPSGSRGLWRPAAVSTASGPPGVSGVRQSG